MMFTQQMEHLTAMVLKKYSQECTTALLDLGLLDFVDITELPGGEDKRFIPLDNRVKMTRLTEARQRIEHIFKGTLEMQWLPPVPDLASLSGLSIEETEEEIDAISRSTQNMREEQRKQQQEIMRLEEMARQLELYREGEILPASNHSFLSILTGTLPSAFSGDLESRLSKLPSVALRLGERDDAVGYLVIVLKRDEKEALSILSDLNWTKRDDSSALPKQDMKTGALGEIRAKISVMKERQKEIAENHARTIQKKEPWLTESWKKLRANELFFTMQNRFSTTDRTVVFSGWVPSKFKTSLEEAVKKASKDSCYIHWQKADEVRKESRGKLNAPVQLTNPKPLRPFEMLVTNYGIPEYGTVDPTPFVAVSYLCMFGLMFGDAGHGIVLLILSFLMKKFLPSTKSGLQNLARLILYCGSAAVVAGVLFGSYFGLPLFPPVWFNYHALVGGHPSGNPGFRSIYDVLLITIYFGITVIGAGLILNWINLVRKKRWSVLFFDKGGILGGWMYAFGVYSGFIFTASGYRDLPGSSVLITGFGIPALLLLIKEPVLSIIHKNRTPNEEDVHESSQHSPVTVFMEWVVELLEIFSGYLANTLSFMRVAGLGIAHVSLMMAFDQIAVNVFGSITHPGGMFIYILGNILVIALEGLSAGIQALRLNYYEFFSKYFSGSGKAYMPISLKNRLYNKEI